MAACGKSAPSATEPVTKTRAAAYADAVNLREADVAPWEQRKPGKTVEPNAAIATDAKCAGAVSPSRWLELRYSPIFARRLVGAMESNVLVLPTTALAVRDAGARLSGRGFSCFVRDEQQLLTGATLTVKGHTLRAGNVEVSRLPDPLPCIPSAFEWRVTYTVTGEPHPRSAPISLTTYLDFFGFNDGPAEIRLRTRGYGAPLPTATERQALTAIYNRAETHKL